MVYLRCPKCSYVWSVPKRGHEPVGPNLSSNRKQAEEVDHSKGISLRSPSGEGTR